MFTGIVEERGRIRAVDHQEGGARIEVEAHIVLGDAAIGSSIAVNGCCLTVIAVGDGWWAADAQVETLERTTLGTLTPGDPVNLERPLRLADRLGGHLVQGHVDARGRITARRRQPDGSVRMRIEAPASLLRYVVEKGSVTVDGISLTVAAVDRGGLEVALVPHTLSVTTLEVAEIGDPVNLEADLVAKYVERLVHDDAAEGS